MESMAANRAADANRELRRIADLQEETGRAMPDKATVEATMNKTAIEKASAVADRAIHTKAMSEAQTKLDIAKQAQKRSEKLTSELGSWIAEKNATPARRLFAERRFPMHRLSLISARKSRLAAGAMENFRAAGGAAGNGGPDSAKEEKLRDVMAALSTQRKKKSSLEAEKLLHRQRVGAMSRPSRTTRSSSGKRQTSQERANGSPRWKNRTSSISQQTKRP